MSSHADTRCRRHAIITPSYAPDFERCRVLVESVLCHASGLDHFLVVDHRDERLFSSLRGPRTHVVPKEDVLPWWLHPLPIGPQWWLSLKGRPVRGWIAQQIVKLSVDAITSAEGCVFIDSDAFLIKPFDPRAAERDGKSPLFREILPEENAHNTRWHAAAAALLGFPAERRYLTNYVANVVTWQRANVLALHQHIERTTGRGWVESLCHLPTMSEYVLYGMFCERVLREASGHYVEDTIRTLNYWGTSPLDLGGLRSLGDKLGAEHVGVMISAKSNTAVGTIRRAFDIGAVAAEPR